MALDGPGEDPDQVPRGGRVGADVAVGPDLVAERRHFLLALVSQDDDRFVRAACAIPLDQFKGIQFARLVADQHGVEGLVAEPGQPGGSPDRLLRTTSEALSAAKASANQPPVRWRLAM